MDNLKRLVAVEQIQLDNAAMMCTLDAKPNHQSSKVNSGPEEVIICPAPLRPSRSPYVVDNLNRFCCTPKSSLSIQRGGTGLEFLDCIWNKDDLEDDVDGGSNCKGFFCGSPPVRTHNPLVHDVQFVRGGISIMATASPSGASIGRAERVPCGASSFSGKSKPVVRIEGFSCSGSEPHCVVPALA
ncbi:hypothetical protein H6P81_013441 [Aristolochia fimbriata]|uniref:Uncharacterized protein n=1 Tax=Aristolochia fimbriata TaxID=158543 RepID=A0AAV7EEZ1_ARIFI|nr:hypothetical protein H6P81_013441 [Aristolochia fimbriata]